MTIEQIVDRCHVSESSLQVVRYVRSRLKPGAWAKLSREDRRCLVTTAIACHQRNRETYRYVMFGR